MSSLLYIPPHKISSVMGGGLCLTMGGMRSYNETHQKPSTIYHCDPCIDRPRNKQLVQQVHQLTVLLQMRNCSFRNEASFGYSANTTIQSFLYTCMMIHKTTYRTSQDQNVGSQSVPSITALQGNIHSYKRTKIFVRPY